NDRRAPAADLVAKMAEHEGADRATDERRREDHRADDRRGTDRDVRCLEVDRGRGERNDRQIDVEHVDEKADPGADKGLAPLGGMVLVCSRGCGRHYRFPRFRTVIWSPPMNARWMGERARTPDPVEGGSRPRR